MKHRTLAHPIASAALACLCFSPQSLLRAASVTGVEYWGAYSPIVGNSGPGVLVDQQYGSSYANRFTNLTPSGATVNVSGSAASSFGILHAEGSINVTNAPANQYYAFSSVAWMEDTITINEAGLTGQSGDAVFSVGLDGTFSSTATTTLQLAPADAYVLIQNTVPQQYCCGPGPTGFTLSGAQGYRGPSDVLSASRALDFTYGTPFTLYIELEAGGGLLPASSNVSGWSGNAAADFSNTLVLDGINVYQGTTANPGPQVTDFTIASDSGTVYTSQGVVTPEPATMALAAFAMIVGLLLKIANQR